MKNIDKALVKMTKSLFLIAALSLMLTQPTFAGEYDISEEAVDKKLGGTHFSPYAGGTYPIKVLWGDQHLHTEVSVDAGTMCRLTVWNDPDFDSKQHAFYYARVIEIPPPRWTAYEAKRYGIELPAYVPMVTQERAYTSPIWYTPDK